MDLSYSAVSIKGGVEDIEYRRVPSAPGGMPLNWIAAATDYPPRLPMIWTGTERIDGID